MLRGGKIRMLCVLVGLFAICTANRAWAGTYTTVHDGVCDSQDDPGTCSVTAGGWVIEIAPGTSTGHVGEFPVFCNGTDTSLECKDKKGNPITGYRFGYYIKAPTGGSLAQADVLCENCGITITYPTDRSVKILDQDPNNPTFGAGPIYVLSWDALKLDQSGKTYIAAYTTKAGAGMQAMLLQTGTGAEVTPQDQPILGPICCVEYAGIVTERTVGDTTAHYDACTGRFVSVSASDSSSLTAVPGLFNCWSTGDFDPKQCSPIKKLGPASGAFLDVAAVRGNPGDHYDGTRYYGYGGRFFKQSISGTVPDICTETVNPALVEDMMTFDNRVIVKFKKCGDIDSVTIDGRPATKVFIWIFEADAHGKMTDVGGPLVNSGPRNSAIIDDWIYPSYGSGWGYR